jgi:hypothetical protein
VPSSQFFISLTMVVHTSSLMTFLVRLWRVLRLFQDGSLWHCVVELGCVCGGVVLDTATIEQFRGAGATLLPILRW